MPDGAVLNPEGASIAGHRTCEVVNLDTTTLLYKELIEAETRDGVKLIVTRKRPGERSRERTPIILIHGLGQNRFSYDLSRRSMMNFLVSEGFDVYNAELRGHGLSRANGSPYPKAFDDYVDYGLPALIDFVRRLSHHDKVFIIGHSLGGTISYAEVGCVSARRRSMRAEYACRPPSDGPQASRLTSPEVRCPTRSRRSTRNGSSWRLSRTAPAIPPSPIWVNSLQSR